MNTFQCLRFICGWIPHHRWHRVFDGRPVWYFSQHMLATATFPFQDKSTTKVLQQSFKELHGTGGPTTSQKLNSVQ